MISLDCIHLMWTMRTWIYFSNGKQWNVRSKSRLFTQEFYISKENKGTKLYTKTFVVHTVGQISKLPKLSVFLHFQLGALNTIPLTDFTQYFCCALSLCLDKSAWLAQSKHLHQGGVHSGLNEYTVKKPRHLGKVGTVLGYSFIYKPLCPRCKAHASYFQWCQCIKLSAKFTR